MSMHTTHGTQVKIKDGDGDVLEINADGSINILAASLPLPAGAATAANQLPDGHNVTVDNASGGSAVNIQDGGNSITIDTPAATPLPVTDPTLNISRGLVTGVSHVNKFGRNDDIDTAMEDVWTVGTVMTYPAAADTIQISSDDADDTSAGAGANTVTILGLNGSYVLTEETISTNGTADVPTVNEYIRIYRMFVATAGASGWNEGTITAISDSGSALMAQIEPAGNNQTEMTHYTVPADKKGYMTSYYASIDRTGTTATIDVDLFVRPFGGVFQLKHHVGLTATGSSEARQTFNPYLLIEGKSDIVIRAAGSTVNNDVHAGFDLILVDD